MIFATQSEAGSVLKAFGESGQYRLLLKQASIIAEIELLAQSLEPKIAATIFAALQQQADNVVLQAIADALAAGHVDAVLSMLGVSELDAFIGPVKDTLMDAVWDSGAMIAARLPSTLGRGVEFQFNRLNPRLIDWLNSYSLNLVREINDETKKGVRVALVEGMQAGEGPHAVARSVKQVVGLTERQAKAVLSFRKELERFHLKRSAKAWGLGNKQDKVNGHAVFRYDTDGTAKDGIDLRRLRDYRYDKTLARALETGKPLKPAQIDKMVDAYKRRYLQYRSRVIARTEALRAANVGIQDAWRQAIEKGAVDEFSVRREWIVTPDERLCPHCRPIPEMNPKRGVMMAQPFATPRGPVMLPPVHPQCRCVVFIRQWEPEQLKDDAPGATGTVA